MFRGLNSTIRYNLGLGRELATLISADRWGVNDHYASYSLPRAIKAPDSAKRVFGHVYIFIPMSGHLRGPSKVRFLFMTCGTTALAHRLILRVCSPFISHKIT